MFSTLSDLAKMSMCDLFGKFARQKLAEKEVRRILTVELRPSQLQHDGTNDCALFAIFNCLLVSSGIDAESVAIEDQDFRERLADSLFKGRLDEVPLADVHNRPQAMDYYFQRTEATVLDLAVEQFLGLRKHKDTLRQERPLVCFLCFFFVKLRNITVRILLTSFSTSFCRANLPNRSHMDIFAWSLSVLNMVVPVGHWLVKLAQ
jgi:hypothetical protein